jgi:hypothetical protein
MLYVLEFVIVINVVVVVQFDDIDDLMQIVLLLINPMVVEWMIEKT